MRAVIGFLIGITFTYLVGSLVSWSFNPGEWHMFWRFISVVFALFWGVIGLVIGIEADSNIRYLKKLRKAGRR